MGALALCLALAAPAASQTSTGGAAGSRQNVCGAGVCGFEQGTDRAICIDDVPCPQVPDCATSADCPAGEACRKDDNCCGVPVCAPLCDPPTCINPGNCNVGFAACQASTVNHFLCYEVRRRPRFAGVSGLTLEDQFELATGDLDTRKRLCNPVDKNGEDPTAPQDVEHLVAYELENTTPRFTGLEDVTISNQFGDFLVDIARPDRLLVPSAKELATAVDPNDPPALDPNNPAPLDHYKCYRVRRARTRVPDLQLEDQFGMLTADVKRPRSLCLPVDKNGEGITDAQTHLTCYKVRTRPKRLQSGVAYFISNQFESDDVVITGPREICVPSEKRLPVPTPTPTLTPVPTPTPTVTPTVTASLTPTVTPTVTPTLTPTVTPTMTAGCMMIGTGMCGGPCPNPNDSCQLNGQQVCVCAPRATPTVTITPALTATMTPGGPPTFTPVTTPTLTPIPVDHYRLYDTDIPISQPPQVSLIDQFLAIGTTLTPIQALLNPVDKNGEGIARFEEHLAAYALNDPPQFGANVLISNQFGQQPITVGPPVFLLVPSEKSLTSLPSPLPLTIDHYLCYVASGTNNATVSLTDQFLTSPSVSIGNPALFCNPVQKNNEPIRRPDQHLTCYQHDEVVVDFMPFIRNQFENGQTNADLAFGLCLPTLKLGFTINPTPTPTATLTPTPTPTSTPICIPDSGEACFQYQNTAACFDCCESAGLACGIPCFAAASNDQCLDAASNDLCAAQIIAVGCADECNLCTP